ncbi:MAG: Rieske (2Fe-2S) protein, partial [Myxococcota bacterium]
MSGERTRVGVYRRVVEGSIERIWENVFDWEHLPWLHRGSFSAIELIESRTDGWRAHTRLQGGARAEIDLVTQVPDLRYVARNCEGAGKGTEIWTRLEELGPRRTAIEVEFWVPGVDPDAAAQVGAGYERLYARLWDEDERMIVARQRFLDARPERARERALKTREIDLGPAESLSARLPLLVRARGETWRVVSLDGEWVVHAATCPHLAGPLDEAMPDREGCVTCPWHGYRFDVRSGRSADGRRLRLRKAPRVEVAVRDGHARLQWPGPYRKL